MRYGIEVVPFGDFSDPRAIVRLAQAAEDAGWEAIWIWDHMLIPYGAGDPWVTLAAVAAATTSLKLCTGVAPLPRYRPHLLARTLAALDILSAGRVIFGTGLGIAPDFTPFGEPGDDKTRAAMTDEGLDLLARLWSGEPVTHHGRFYTAEEVCLVPDPSAATAHPRLDRRREQSGPPARRPVGWLDHGHGRRAQRDHESACQDRGAGRNHPPAADDGRHVRNCRRRRLGGRRR